ncbi:tetratricopeptide repeat protein [Acetobacter cibinongensis]|uniref:N-acetylglucosamine transferase n=1 Tax=Acetobacter cibinongensis TaxID=146475 RepID=A0A1Z5YU63_9PROT|nr:tetratricopeptide repeat protein [Acetobacter cibinongensis]OUJ02035.1 N-acetylglucosamine transferase [Acetobacter cibinongensis]
MQQVPTDSEHASVNAALELLAHGNAELAAERLTALVRAAPENAEAWHGLACVARANGSADSALKLAAKAITLSPQAHFHITMGLALLMLGHTEPARAAVNVAVMQTPRDPRAHQAMADVLEAQGRLEDAAQALKNALRLRPLETDRHLALAAFLARHGRVAEGIRASQKAVALEPNNIFVQNQHALLLERAGKMRDAAPHFAQVAAALPENAAALANYGAALFAQGAFEEARQVLTQSVHKQPNAAETHSNLGLVHMALGALPEAVEHLQAACTRCPDDARLATNYGTALAESGRTAEAEVLFRRAMALPGASEQDRARARFNLGPLLLGEGRFEDGWRYFEARKDLLPQGHTQGLPDWKGQTQTTPVLLYAEQGLGDTLQFSRYITHAASRAPVLLVVPSAVRGLMMRLDWGDAVTVLPEGAHAAEYGATAACSLLSLPYVLGMAEPFAWQPQVDLPCLAPAVTEQIRVGLCWAGNPTYRFDRRRSLNPVCLEPLARVEGVSFHSLQQNPENLPPFALAPLPEGDLVQTASIIQGLDAVVTVDTGMAHLAGLLGKPTWLLNRFGGDWRWAQGAIMHQTTGEERSLWYPSVRVVTQPQAGEGMTPWHEPVARVAAALQALVQKPA